MSINSGAASFVLSVQHQVVSFTAAGDHTTCSSFTTHIVCFSLTVVQTMYDGAFRKASETRTIQYHQSYKVVNTLNKVCVRWRWAELTTEAPGCINPDVWTSALGVVTSCIIIHRNILLCLYHSCLPQEIQKMCYIIIVIYYFWSRSGTINTSLANHQINQINKHPHVANRKCFYLILDLRFVLYHRLYIKHGGSHKWSQIIWITPWWLAAV